LYIFDQFADQFAHSAKAEAQHTHTCPEAHTNTRTGAAHTYTARKFVWGNGNNNDISRSNNNKYNNWFYQHARLLLPVCCCFSSMLLSLLYTKLN